MEKLPKIDEEDLLDEKSRIDLAKLKTQKKSNVRTPKAFGKTEKFKTQNITNNKNPVHEIL